MILVEGGTFQMGGNLDLDSDDEKPVHSVTVESFYIGKYEVTQREYREVMEQNPSYFKGDDLPVEQVSWWDAINFCNALSRKEGLPEAYNSNGDLLNNDGYRLPTEAEWEYAARGGNKSENYKYSGGNEQGDLAWYIENSGNTTHTVGSKNSNELTLHDLTGNVWEWVSDWYDVSYYSKSPAKNPYNTFPASYRVIRGGAWNGKDISIRISNRNSYYPFGVYSYLGFRIAKSKSLVVDP